MFKELRVNDMSAWEPQVEAEWEVALEGQVELFVAPGELVANGKDRSNDNNWLMRLGLQCRWRWEPGR